MTRAPRLLRQLSGDNLAMLVAEKQSRVEDLPLAALAASLEASSDGIQAVAARTRAARRAAAAEWQQTGQSNRIRPAPARRPFPEFVVRPPDCQPEAGRRSPRSKNSLVSLSRCLVGKLGLA